MSEPVDKKFVKVPTYMDVFDELVWGFGLAPSHETKLAFSRSWERRQARYAEKGNEPWLSTGRGMFSELLALLGGGDQGVRERLAECFTQYEEIISHLRGRFLITFMSHEDGVEAFLRILAFPQVAVLLSKMHDEFPAESPMRHLRYFIFEIVKGRSTPENAIKNAIRLRLDKLDGVDSSDIRISLSKIDARSAPKLKTILEQTKDLEECVRAKRGEGSVSQVLEIRGLYIAGVAIKRFVRRMSTAVSAGRAKELLVMLCGYFMVIERSDAPDDLKIFIEAHLALYGEIRRGFVDFGGTQGSDATTFASLAQCFEQAVNAIDPEECIPLSNALDLFERGRGSEEIKNELKKASKEDGFFIFRALSEYVLARVALLEGDFEKAIQAFRRVINISNVQQIGNVGVSAANAVIALELKTSRKWVKGYLDPLVAYLAENLVQEYTFKVAIPTPFSTFSDAPDINDSSMIIFNAVADFNREQCEQPPGFRRAIYNPFDYIDREFVRVFSLYDEVVSTGYQSVSAADVFASCSAAKINNSNSVFRFLTLSPYEVLRDILFFFDRVFFGDISIACEICPGIYRYLSLGDDVKLGILRSLDACAYSKDEARYFCVK